MSYWPKEMRGWQTSDGQMFDERAEAELHEAKLGKDALAWSLYRLSIDDLKEYLERNASDIIKVLRLISAAQDTTNTKQGDCDYMDLDIGDDDDVDF